jgi:hypothetical protein
MACEYASSSLLTSTNTAVNSETSLAGRSATNSKQQARTGAPSAKPPNLRMSSHILTPDCLSSNGIESREAVTMAPFEVK